MTLDSFTHLVTLANYQVDMTTDCTKEVYIQWHDSVLLFLA